VNVEQLPDVFPEAYALRCLPPKEGYFDERIVKILKKNGYRRTTSRKCGASVFFPILFRGGYPKGFDHTDDDVKIVLQLAELVGERPDENYLSLFKKVIP
jgi:hypothetical protein